MVSPPLLIARSQLEVKAAGVSLVMEPRLASLLEVPIGIRNFGIPKLSEQLILSDGFGQAQLLDDFFWGKTG